jgi:hypothetical protein
MDLHASATEAPVYNSGGKPVRKQQEYRKRCGGKARVSEALLVAFGMFARDHHGLSGDRMNRDRHAGPLHEQAGYVIDRRAIDQRL